MSEASKYQNLLKVGDLYTGYQKSLSKSSEYFFSELSVTITSLDYSTGYVWGMIEKKIISIQGKKE